MGLYAFYFPGRTGVFLLKRQETPPFYITAAFFNKAEILRGLQSETQLIGDHSYKF